MTACVRIPRPGMSQFVGTTGFARTGAWAHSRSEAAAFAAKNTIRKLRPAAFLTHNLSYDRMRADPEARFDLLGDDVLVFLHIQKTGGTTVEKFLTRHLELETPCRCQKGRKRCFCPRSESDPSQWLFSRFSTGWSCGLHADWTELVESDCVDNVLDKREGRRKRRFFYTTMLREPVARYISEWRHVQRGATWLASPHVCEGRPARPDELPACFDPEQGWDGVSLQEFLDCPHNLAANRMTRMLADLSLVHCYDQGALPAEKRDALLLQSAQHNLESMAFFGLLDHMSATQALFQHVFQLRFKKSMGLAPHASKSNRTELSQIELSAVRKRNALDLRLYAFAKDLFARRLAHLPDYSSPSAPITPSAETLTILDVEDED